MSRDLRKPARPTEAGFAVIRAQRHKGGHQPGSFAACCAAARGISPATAAR